MRNIANTLKLNFYSVMVDYSSVLCAIFGFLNVSLNASLVPWGGIAVQYYCYNWLEEHRSVTYS